MAVLEYLKGTKSHPTAEEIYLSLKPKLRRLSRGTVYRNLDFLKKQGLILEIPDARERTHFDACLAAHDHFYCQKCQRIYDFNEKTILKNSPKNLQKRGFKINFYQLIFFGHCQKCQKKGEEKHA